MMDKSKETAPVNNSEQDIQTLQRIVMGMKDGLATVLRGKQYDGARDVYEALGYEDNPTFDNYYTQYKRQDIAKAIINKPISATWRGPLIITEADDDEETPLEKEWLALEDRLKLKGKLIQLDKWTGLGHYGVLFMGLSDTKTRAELINPVESTSGVELLYVKPLSEFDAKVNTWEMDITNERYGLPLTYKITITAPSTHTTENLVVHYSRVIHVAEGLMADSITGEPRLEVVFNRLKDLEKLVGGSAEMFWRGARPGYHGEVSPETQMTEEEKGKLKEQLDEYEHNLRRFLVSSGVSVKSLATQVADPSNHVDVQIQMISAVTGIPKRILTGSERGELASSQDATNWLENIQQRRDEFAEPIIVRPFVDRLIEYGVLPAPVDKYMVDWEDLWSTSDKDKAAVGAVRATALASYAGSPYAMDIMPPSVFLKYILNMSDDDITQIEEMRKEAQLEEEKEAASQEEEALAMELTAKEVEDKAKDGM